MVLPAFMHVPDRRIIGARIRQIHRQGTAWRLNIGKPPSTMAVPRTRTRSGWPKSVFAEWHRPDYPSHVEDMEHISRLDPLRYGADEAFEGLPLAQHTCDEVPLDDAGQPPPTNSSSP